MRPGYHGTTVSDRDLGFVFNLMFLPQRVIVPAPVFRDRLSELSHECLFDANTCLLNLIVSGREIAVSEKGSLTKRRAPL